MGRDETVEYLTEGEALRLAATVPVGRVVYSRYAMPAVHLVNFRLDGRDVVFKTRKGAKFAAAVADTVVAFEVDQIDEAGRSGWTVTITGRSGVVTRAEEIARLEKLDVDPWVAGREFYVRIRTGRVAGRRIGPQDLHGHDADYEEFDTIERPGGAPRSSGSSASAEPPSSPSFNPYGAFDPFQPATSGKSPESER